MVSNEAATNDELTEVAAAAEKLIQMLFAQMRSKLRVPNRPAKSLKPSHF